MDHANYKIGVYMDSITKQLSELGIEPMNGKKFKPLTRQEIDDLEERIGTSLPETYRFFLGSYGSSMFSIEINCTPKGNPIFFGSFYGFDEIIDALDSYREALPQSIIPIGDDGGGNLFCLGVQGKDSGRVFFHNHNIGWRTDADKYLMRGEQVPSEIRYQTVFEIAPSFEAFVQFMVKVPD